MSTGGTSYRFGPLEKRGVLLGWRGGQIIAVVLGLVSALFVLRAVGGIAGGVGALGIVLLALAAAWLPLGGLTAEQWCPTLIRWLRFVVARSITGQRKSPLDDLHMIDAGPTQDGGGSLGVVHDVRTQTLTGVLELQAPGFALLGSDEKDRRVARWSTVLASIARERSVAQRVQWLFLATPDDGRALWRDFGQRAVLNGSVPARRSYAELLRRATDSLLQHRVLLSLQIGLSGPSGRRVRAAGGGVQGGCSVLRRELTVLSKALAHAEVVVRGPLDARQLERVIHRAWALRAADVRAVDARAADAPALVGRAARDRAPKDCAADSRAESLPTRIQAQWRRVQIGETWHAAYWIAEWPRVDVGAEFLAPLMVSRSRRSLSVVMEPQDPSKAMRSVQRARMSDMADAELRRRGGFLGTARKAREFDVVNRREADLADGHGAYRFSGYLTVTAESPEALQGACESAEQEAAQCGLELRALNGQHDLGALCGLPLCVGIR